MRIGTIAGSIRKLTKFVILNTVAYSSLFRQLTGIGYFGLNKIDRQIERYLVKDSGYYVELGANDGIKQSNTLTLEKYRRWNGLLIEPHPGNFQKLIRNRSSRNQFENCACVNAEFSSEKIEMVYSDLMTIQTEGLQDIVDPIAHAIQGGEFLKNESVAKFQATARTLTQLLEKNNAPEKMQLLSLDVEGAEMGVLQGLDFDRYSFEVICVETRELEKIQTFLESQSYNLVERISHHDYVFVKNKSVL